ncbi:MAG TPA: hypothetical protein VKE69_02555, partial [Planctomycetota bacterium]|nr:hypothetical protein [Planctomycetota bacterium]
RHVSYSPTAYGRRGTVWIDAEPEPTKEAKVDARVDAESNRITIEADAVTRIRLLLSDALLDLSKPVTITINGDRPFEGKLPPSMSTLYQCLDEAGGLDPGAIYTVTHTVSVRPKRSTKDATPASGSGNGGSGSEKK